MNEIKVPLEITGIGEIKKQLRELKGAIDAATDPKQIADLTQQAGALKDRLADANEQVNIFASGSKFEQISNGLGSIKDSIMSLDFAEAGDKAKLLTTALKGINPAEFATQFKGFGTIIMSLGSAVGILTKQFIAFGVSLLANPIFLLVAVITAVVAVILLWLNKMGLLKKAIDFIMKPINDLIQGFKELTDWLGLTSYAAEENAARTLAANEKVVASSKDRQEKVVSQLDYEIKKAKIYGKDTVDLEIERSKQIGIYNKKRLESAKEALNDQLALGDKANKEEIKKLKDQIKETEGVILEERRNRDIIISEDVIKRREEADKQAKEDLERAKKFAADRLSAQRIIKDIEIALIKNDADREIVATQEKYARLIEDVQKNESYTNEEKIRLKQLYKQQLEFELGKVEEAEINAEKDKQKKINDLIKANQEAQQQAEEDFYEVYRTQIMTEQQREEDAVNKKYYNLIADAEKYHLDTKILEEQQAEEIKKIKDKYREAEIKAEKDKNDKIRAQNFETAKKALDTAQASVDGIQALSDINFNAKMSKLKKGSKEEEKYAKKQFEINKALQLSTAIINGAQSILAITSVPDFTLGVASAIRIASQVAITAATVAKIASTQFNSTTAGGSQPNIANASSTSTTGQATPAYNLYGQGNNMNNVSQNNQMQQNITVTAVVSETELTNTQNKITQINKNATL